MCACMVACVAQMDRACENGGQQPYIDKAKEDIVRYTNEMAAYKQTAAFRASMTTVGWIPCQQCGASEHTGRIPRLIFQTWKALELEPVLCRGAVKWAAVNPEYDYLLFDDVAAKRMIEIEFGAGLLEAFNCINVGAAKSDVWRLLAIYLFGGIYFDLDSAPKPEHPFRTWGFGNHSIVTGVGGDGDPHQWGLIYTPQHPVIRAAVLEMLDNVANRRPVGNTYDIAYDAFQNGFRSAGGYMMSDWGDAMGGRVDFVAEDKKIDMLGHQAQWGDFLGPKL
jgi:hypothetical protein